MHTLPNEISETIGTSTPFAARNAEFGFEAAAILAWIASLRHRGIVCPVRVGIAGPASVATLAKSVRCDLGASLRALARGHAAFARVLTKAGPDALIDAIVAAETPVAMIDGLHIFMFSGVRRAAEWRRARVPPYSRSAAGA